MRQTLQMLRRPPISQTNHQTNQIFAACKTKQVEFGKKERQFRPVARRRVRGKGFQPHCSHLGPHSASGSFLNFDQLWQMRTNISSLHFLQYKYVFMNIYVTQVSIEGLDQLSEPKVVAIH